MKFDVEIWKKWIRKRRQLKKDQLLILFLAGVLLLVITVPTGNEKESSSEKSQREKTTVSFVDYTEEMERELEEVLSQMNGVGDVKVMMTLASTAEKVVEKDRDNQSEQRNETDQKGGERITSQDISSEETVYEKQNTNGDVPYVTKEMTPKVEGVLVLATGGDRPEVAGKITEAVQALFGIDTHKIRIMKKMTAK